MGVGWVALLVGSRIDCWNSHTGLDEVTDVGLKAFSAALGSSTINYSNGDVYVGSFQEGERHGDGKMAWAGQDKEYNGQWNDGVPHGKGKIRIGEKIR